MLDRIEAAAARRRLARRGVNPDARPEPTMSMGSDCLPQIEHIVILMMENHSYDNYFGMLAGRGGGLSPLRERTAPPRETFGGWGAGPEGPPPRDPPEDRDCHPTPGVPPLS